MRKDSMEKITAMSLRRSLGEFLNRVKYQDEVFIVERSGEPLAAIISIHALDKLQGAMGEDIQLFLEETRKIQKKSALPAKKKSIPPEGSIELLGDIKEGSKEISEQFKKSLNNTAKKL